jgi:hypothetical protein
LEAKYFRFSKSKIEYIKCDFNATIQEGDVIHGQVLRSMLKKNGNIDEDVSYIIKVRWLK